MPKPLFERSLAIEEKSLGPNHYNLAAPLDGLALLYVSQGDYEAAEPLHNRALAIREKVVGPHHLHVASSLENLADLYRKNRQKQRGRRDDEAGGSDSIEVAIGRGRMGSDWNGAKISPVNDEAEAKTDRYLQSLACDPSNWNFRHLKAIFQ